VLIPAFGDQLGSAVGTASADAAAITVHSLMILPFRAYDRIIGVLALLRLVPDRPYTAEDLAFFHELSNRAALALDNARLYDETQAAVRARDEFLSAAAHELRTPITTVKGYAQMLLRAQIRAGLASDHASQFLQAIDEATERLRVLADDLLDVSHLRLGQMPLHLQPLDLVDLAGRTIRRLEPGLDARYTLILESQWPAAVVHADPNRIEQVLANILNNAVKYSPAGGEIRTVIATDGAGIRLSVRDPGIGLPPEAVESIFAPFNRADNAVRDNIPGLGLGLYICDSIVRRHGGRITAESAGEGHGTTFHLWLPTNGSPDADPPG
jgi:signal transduction histidine kinase